MGRKLDLGIKSEVVNSCVKCPELTLKYFGRLVALTVTHFRQSLGTQPEIQENSESTRPNRNQCQVHVESRSWSGTYREKILEKKLHTQDILSQYNFIQGLTISSSEGVNIRSYAPPCAGWLFAYKVVLSIFATFYYTQNTFFETVFS